MWENWGLKSMIHSVFLRERSVIVEAVPAPSKLASMYRNTKSELPGGSGLADISLLRLSMTRELKCLTSHVHQG